MALRLDGLAPHSLAEIARLLPEVSRRSVLRPPESPDTTAAKGRFFEGVLSALIAMLQPGGVLFVDSGTVTEDIGFDDYRVSIGFGIRLYIPQFGEVPIAFDFGFPLLKEDTDEEQLISFSAELPF